MGSITVLTTFALIFFNSVTAVTEQKAVEGYAMGLIPNCPGSTKPAGIRPKSLKKLGLSVLGPGDLLDAKWTLYSYFHMKSLAEHPDIDFKNKKTFIFVPGYTDNNAFPLGRGLAHYYRKMGYNALFFNFVHFTTDVLPVVARFMRPVGKHSAEMLVELTKHGLDPKDLQLIGLSLGAQTMSFIAKNFREITGKNISTLIGLDAAGPCYRNLGPDQRLDKSDADFVVSVASNADGFGMAYPTGHVTFYVNGGEWQPGEIWWFPCGVMCSHSRSYFIWIAALLNPGKFIGIQCDSVQQAREGGCYEREPKVTNTLDLFTDRSKPGIYYLATTNRYPYYLGKKGTEREGDPIFKFGVSLNKDEMVWI